MPVVRHLLSQEEEEEEATRRYSSINFLLISR